MKSFKPKPEMFDTRTLSQKMQDQEKAAQRKEALQEAQAKAKAKEERELEMRPMRHETNPNDWNFQVEQRLSEIVNELSQIRRMVTKLKVMEAPNPTPTVDGGHPVLTNGKPALFIDIPSFETCMKAAEKYQERHGKGTVAPIVATYGVKKISEIPEEKRAEFIERLSNDKPEGLDG